MSENGEGIEKIISKEKFMTHLDKEVEFYESQVDKYKSTKHQIEMHLMLGKKGKFTHDGDVYRFYLYEEYNAGKNGKDET